MFQQFSSDESLDFLSETNCFIIYTVISSVFFQTTFNSYNGYDHVFFVDIVD